MTHRNRELLVAAARVMQPLAEELVFVGGCTTGLMITDVAAADTRSTYDVDVIAEIASYSEYRALGKRLRSLGFQEDTSEGAPLHSSGRRWRPSRSAPAGALAARRLLLVVVLVVVLARAIRSAPGARVAAGVRRGPPLILVARRTSSP